MPRRVRRDASPAGRRAQQVRPPASMEEITERIRGSAGAQVDGFVSKTSRADEKRYRCPYCEGWIEPKTMHIVAFPTGRPEDRRHYHSGCWAKQNQAKPGGSKAG